MKSFVSVFAFFAAVGSAFAAAPNMAPATGRGRASMSNQMMAVPRAVASKAQISAGAALTPESAVVNKSSIKADGGTLSNPDTAPDESVSTDKEQEKKDKERQRSIRNVAKSGGSTVGREVGQAVGKAIAGDFGKKLGGNLGASLGRNILGTLFKMGG